MLGTYLAQIEGLGRPVSFVNRHLRCSSVCSASNKKFSWKSRWGTIHTLRSLFFPSASHPRGQGWLPVILLFCVNVCCSITTTLKLFLSCSAVIESTAHDCCPRALGINHTDHTRMCVYVCVLVHACVTSLLFLRVTIGYEEHSFCPLAPGNANGLAKRSAGKWGIEELFHSLSSLSTYISRLHFPFHEKTCLWMLLIFYLDVRYQG